MDKLVWLAVTLCLTGRALTCTTSGWSNWINEHNVTTTPFPEEAGEAHLTVPGGDIETSASLLKHFCVPSHGNLIKIQCMTAIGEKNYTDQTLWGHITVRCDVQTGLKCSNRLTDQQMCLDYKVRFYCNCTATVTMPTTTTIETTTTQNSTTSTSPPKPTTTQKQATTLTPKTATATTTPTTTLTYPTPTPTTTVTEKKSITTMAQKIIVEDGSASQTTAGVPASGGRGGISGSTGTTGGHGKLLGGGGMQTMSGGGGVQGTGNSGTETGSDNGTGSGISGTAVLGSGPGAPDNGSAGKRIGKNSRASGGISMLLQLFIDDSANEFSLARQ